MQALKFVIFAILIIGINACAPTKTNTTATGRKRRSIEEDLTVTIKVFSDIKKEVKIQKLEEFTLTKLSQSLPAISPNIEESSTLGQLENGKKAVTITIPNSLTYCSDITTSLKELLKKETPIDEATIKCGEKEPVYLFH
uniref:Cyclophil_like2 domain-containing protein n=1 Tax=Strongyloides papillosus TaxID=174720 RepID=A0A0N5BCY7_STREA